MSTGGYTPVFNGALDGTLYGKWPHTGIWLCLLSQCDRHGQIDMVPQLLAAKIGVSEAQLLACIHEFMQPDPGSRACDLEGRRLELIDPKNRDWGWQVINHGMYRERARKAVYNADRTESGEDAERKRQARMAENRKKSVNDAVRRSPAKSGAVRLSDAAADADADADAESRKDIHHGAASASPNGVSAGSSKPKKAGKGKIREFDLQVIDAYREICPHLPRVVVWAGTNRPKMLEARIQETCARGLPANTIDYWRNLFETVAASDLLSGRTTKWRANLAWLLRVQNFVKLVEGNYDNPRGANDHG